MKNRTYPVEKYPYFIFIFSFLLISSIVAPYNTQGQMRGIRLGANNYNDEIRSIFFLSSSTGYFGLSKSQIGFTDDSGRTISYRSINELNVNPNGTLYHPFGGMNIQKMHVFSQDEILVFGVNFLTATILSSEDGGRTYKVVYYNPPTQTLYTNISDMAFPRNSPIGFAIDGGTILKTTNKGKTWNSSSNQILNADQLVLVDENNIYAYKKESISIGPKIFKTTDGGKNWSVVNPPVTGSDFAVSSLYFLNNNDGWLVGYKKNEGTIFYKTNDGGNSWHRLAPFSYDHGAFNMYFTNQNEGYILAESYQIFKTLDGGIIWEPIEKYTNYKDFPVGNFNTLFFLNENQFWAGGSYEYLEISTNRGGNPLPRAFFTMDTIGYSITGKVKSNNMSRKEHSFQWYLNNQFISSGYNFEYTHDKRRTSDNIKLIASNGPNKDSGSLAIYFPKVVFIDSFYPKTARAGDTITIKGKGFESPIEVRFGGIPATVIRIVSDSLIQAIVNEGASGNVYVNTINGFKEIPGFIFISKPEISGFTPEKARAGSKVTISGREFSTVSNVYFEGIPALSFTIISDNIIEAIVPSGRSGAIKLINNGGIASKSGFVALASLTSFTPLKASRDGFIFISGTSLLDIEQVYFGGTPAKSFTVESDSLIKAVVATGKSGNVIVSKPLSGDSLPGFTYIEKPLITELSKNFGYAGEIITIKGGNFNKNAQENIVHFGLLKGEVVSGNSTELNVIIPAGFCNDYISVTSNELIVRSPNKFSILFRDGGALTSNSFGIKQVLFPNEEEQEGTQFGLMALNDFNDDGKIDLLLINRPTQDMFIFCNKTPLKSQSLVIENMAQIFFSNYTSIVENLTTNDINGDGKPEVSYIVNDTIYILKNKSEGITINLDTALKIQNNAIMSFAEANRSLQIADMDLDGKNDLILSYQDYLSPVLQVYRNRSTTDSIIFDTPIEFRFDLLLLRYPMLIQDVNHDKKPDFVAIDLYNGNNTIIQNNSTFGNFSFIKRDFSQDLGQYLTSTTLADINNDGTDDLISTEVNGKLLVYKGFQNPQQNNYFMLEKVFDISNDAYNAITGDLNGDGKIELALVEKLKELTFYKTTTSLGAVDLTKSFIINETSGYSPMIIFADFNGDSKPDILGMTQDRLNIYFIPNLIQSDPILTDFFPKSAAENETIVLKGSKLSGTNEVLLGGQSVKSFKIIDDATIEAIVANGATGQIALRRGNTHITMNGFQFKIITPAMKEQVYFRSIKSGNWNDPQTWESSTDPHFTINVLNPAQGIPNSLSKIVTIRSGHSISVTENIITTNTILNQGGILQISPGKIFYLKAP